MSWTNTIADLTASKKMRHVQFLDSVMFQNGTDLPQSYDGTTVITTGGVFSLDDCPVGHYVANFKDRVQVCTEEGVLHSSSTPRFYLEYDALTVSFNVGAEITGTTSNAKGIIYNDRLSLPYDAQSANFTVGKLLTGGTSAATGKIVADTDAGATGTLILEDITGTFVDGETITDSNSTPGSATSNITTGATGTLELIGITGTFSNNEKLYDDGTTPGGADADGVGEYKVSWTDGYITTSIDLDSDKGKCTGMGVIGGLLLIFFERSFYTWNGSALQADPIVEIGCSSQESVAKADGVLFFANNTGVYATRGGYPQRISRFMQDFFDNMSSANYANIAGGSDGEHYFCSIGDVTINNKLIENTVLRYTIKSQEWAVLSYPERHTVYSKYIDGTTVKLVAGTDDGNVIQIDSTDTQDNFAATNAPIDYELDTRDIFEPFEGMSKTINDRIYVHSEDSSGAKLYYRVDSDDEADWKDIGEIKDLNQEFKGLDIDKYKKIRFRIAGRSIKGRMRVQAIEIPNIINNGY